MGLDVKKILDDLNPSKEVMKYIIVGLVTILSGTFLYQKFFPSSDSKNEIKISNELQIKLIQLEYKQRILSTKLKYQNDQLIGSIENLKEYFDKRLNFVIEQEDSKNKKFIQSVFDMSNISAESLIPKIKNNMEQQPIINEEMNERIMLDDSSQNNINITLQKDSNKYVSTSTNEIKVDSVKKKKSLLKRIFKKWD